MNGMPHVIIRSMSDKADGSAHVNFAEFTAQAAENFFRMIEEIRPIRRPDRKTGAGQRLRGLLACAGSSRRALQSPSGTEGTVGVTRGLAMQRLRSNTSWA